MRSLSQKASLLMVANLLKYSVGFIAPMILVRFLSHEQYGTYQQLNLMGGIATSLMVLGLPTSIYYFYHVAANRPAGRQTLIAQTFAILLISGAVTVLALALGTPLLARAFSNPALLSLLPLYALFAGFSVSGEHFMHVMISQDRYLPAVALETLETVIRVGVIVFALYLGFGLHGLVLALMIFALVRLLSRSYFVWSGPDSIRGASRQSIFPGEQLAYSLPLAATVGVGLLGSQMDRMIVALSFSPKDYAIYSVGALEIPLDVIFQASASNVLRATLPALVAAGAYPEIVRIWRTAVRKLALLVIPSTVFLFAFASLFITTLFTPKYLESVSVFRLYVSMLPLHMFVVSVVPQVFGKTRLNLQVVFVAATTNVVLSLVLLRYIGYLGPAVAFVVSSYVASGLYMAVTNRLLKTRLIQLVPAVPMARTIFASCISLIPAAAVTYLTPPGLIELTLAGCAFSLTYVVAAPVVGAVTPEDRRAITMWLAPHLSKARALFQ